jgi:hypothetical protein
MAFNLILDELPDTFRGCSVNTDFRQGLRFFAALADSSLDDKERSAVILRLFFGSAIPSDIESVKRFIDYFINGGGQKKKRERGGKITFDFNVDSGRLFSAFLQAYGIDLRTEKMHWWIFLELFHDLPEDTMLMRVIDIRQKKAPKYAGDEYKQDLYRAKREFAIETSGGSAATLGSALRGWAGR